MEAIIIFLSSLHSPARGKRGGKKRGKEGKRSITSRKIAKGESATLYFLLPSERLGREPSQARKKMEGRGQREGKRRVEIALGVETHRKGGGRGRGSRARLLIFFNVEHVSEKKGEKKRRRKKAAHPKTTAKTSAGGKGIE